MIDDNETQQAIDRLKSLIEAEFTPDEARSLKELVLWWSRFRGAMALGGALGSVAKWALLMAAFVAAIKAGLVEWLMQGGAK
jgi:hypothetical protein